MSVANRIGTSGAVVVSVVSSIVRGGAKSVHLEPFANQEIGQPNVFKQAKLTGGDPLIRAEWEIKNFVWSSEFLDELPPEFEDFLGSLDVDEDDYDLEVLGFYRYRHTCDKNRKCDVNSIYVPLVKVGKYHPYYSVKHRRRASGRTLDRLEFLERECRKRHVKFDYVFKIELTFPKEISEQWDDDDVQYQIREAVKDFLWELHDELFPKQNSQFGAISNHHYWSSKFPLSPHRHVHLTIPNVCYNQKDGMFYRFKPFIDADLVRRVWKTVLKENGLWVGVSDDVEPDVFIHSFKFEQRHRVIHRLSYCCRKPTEDIVEKFKEDDFCRIVKDGDFDEDFALFLLDYTPRVVNLGFLTNLKRFGYSRKSSGMKCPICGGDMVPETDQYGCLILYPRPPPHIPSLYRSRGGEWFRLPSPDDFVGGGV